jgi:DNA-directed RNA polymerase subunit K/omega
VDFDDMIDDELADRKPAWQALEEKVKSSYNRPRSTAERSRQLNEVREKN